MLKLVSKFAMDILPSVIATIVGAYIVNHYINIKPGADASATAAAVSSADSKKANPRGAAKPVEKSADLGNIPEPGVRAKGISEKAIIDKSAAEKPVEKPADKADKPAETASIPPSPPAEPARRHQPTSREKAAARTAPPTVSAPPTEPVIAKPTAVPPAETAVTPDANDLARAAIERLRGSTPEASPRAQETARETVRVPEAPHVVAAPAPAPIMAPPVQPLPPPILVSTPPAESAAKPAYPPTARVDDPHRPTPPADIPDPGPLDLRADAVDSQPHGRRSVAEDMLSAAKSVFHSVIPK
jgi:hypothetical protein